MRKVPGHNDPLPRHQALHDLHLVAVAPARLDLPRLEDAVALDHVDRLLDAGVHDGVRGNGDGGRIIDGQLDVHEHVGTKDEAGVIGLQPDLEGAGGAVELREDLTDTWPKSLCAWCRQCDAHLRSGPQGHVVTLKDIDQHPDLAEVRNSVELKTAIEAEAGRDVSGKYQTVDRCRDPDFLRELPRATDLSDLRLVHSKVPETRQPPTVPGLVSAQAVPHSPAHRPGSGRAC